MVISYFIFNTQIPQCSYIVIYQLYCLKSKLKTVKMHNLYIIYICKIFKISIVIVYCM